MNSLFGRGSGLPAVERAHGCWVTDTNGNQYLDGASGALVVNIGHDDSRVTTAIRKQLDSISYAHPTAFTSEVSERYADLLVERLPMDTPSVYPVAGGSEAVETALKAARAFHLANGQPERSVIIGRELSYHGNTRGALDVSGRDSLRAPYEPWLGHAGRAPGVLEYRCPNPGHPRGCAAWHAAMLEAEIQRFGSHRVAAFIAEPVGGAASGAAVPPDDYWDAITGVCRKHGVLLIADEVMTGFGRTGEWFASEHFGLVPDIMTMAKGASSGYWPLGVCALSGKVTEALESGGFVHGFTYSHHIVGCAAGAAVIKRMEQLGLVERARRLGPTLETALRDATAEHPAVGDVRGIGLLWAIELVADRDTGEPFPAEERAAARLTALAKDVGLLLYPSTGVAGNGLGDLVMVGPPLIIREEEIEMLADRLAKALAGLT
ncbi:MAG TPA: aspartate aminotransferase family protein [Acidimicrobiia bacterium]|nr:aspartate aminotransferase family protein [Acidimicrobiia bacterium]